MAALENVLQQDGLTMVRLRYMPPTARGGKSQDLDKWRGDDLPAPHDVETVADAHGEPGKYRVLSYLGSKQGLSHQWTVQETERPPGPDADPIAKNDRLWRAQDHSLLAAEMVSMARVNSELVGRIHEADSRERIAANALNQKLLREMANLRVQAAQAAEASEGWVEFAGAAMETMRESPQLATMFGAGAKEILARVSSAMSTSRTTPPPPGPPASQEASDEPGNPDSEAGPQTTH